jgi:hypothetical protein
MIKIQAIFKPSTSKFVQKKVQEDGSYFSRTLGQNDPYQ